MIPFSEHGLVDLVLEGDHRRAARVTAVGRRHILLTLFAEPTGTPIGPDFTAAVLEGTNQRGVARVEGAVASILPVAERQTLTFKPADPLTLRQRRSASRVALDRGVLLTRAGTADAAVSGRVVNISADGMRFRSASSFSVGETLFVAFDPGGARPLPGAEGRVVRVQPDGDCALVFADGRDARRSWVDRVIRSARVAP